MWNLIGGKPEGDISICCEECGGWILKGFRPMLPYLKIKVYATHTSIQSQCRWFLSLGRTHPLPQLPPGFRQRRPLLRTAPLPLAHSPPPQKHPTLTQTPLHLPFQKLSSPPGLQNRQIGQTSHIGTRTQQSSCLSCAENTSNYQRQYYAWRWYVSWWTWWKSYGGRTWIILS